MPFVEKSRLQLITALLIGAKKQKEFFHFWPKKNSFLHPGGGTLNATDLQLTQGLCHIKFSARTKLEESGISGCRANEARSKTGGEQ